MRGRIFSAWPVVLALAAAGMLAWWLVPALRGDYRTTPEFRKMGLAKLAVLTATGQEMRLTVRVADEQDEQLAGFQHIGRRVMARSLILFVFLREFSGMFHMRNVVGPLDIAFAKADGKIFSIMRMDPGSKLYGPDGPFQYALEAPAGFFAKKGITVGAKLVLPMGQSSLGPGAFPARAAWAAASRAIGTRKGEQLT
ncbi:MAG: DUF192 domain-containing protein [Candidatus Acetothermia bacterium]|nr:DUF192 domain-containing protein [Candidatus Acetothermia bacterium]MDH7505744.1 DUF192 domain-containing protein [Candidatus Acetothermia bacterium]